MYFRYFNYYLINIEGRPTVLYSTPSGLKVISVVLISKSPGGKRLLPLSWVPWAAEANKMLYLILFPQLYVVYYCPHFTEQETEVPRG